MAGSKTTHASAATGLWRGLAMTALPRLAELPPGERDEAIEQARNAEFDGWERVGMIAGVALTAYLLRFELPPAHAWALPLRYLVQFAAAVPLLVLLVGPFYLRCARRGLDQVIASRTLAHPKEARHESRPPGP